MPNQFKMIMTWLHPSIQSHLEKCSLGGTTNSWWQASGKDQTKRRSPSSSCSQVEKSHPAKSTHLDWYYVSNTYKLNETYHCRHHHPDFIRVTISISAPAERWEKVVVSTWTAISSELKPARGRWKWIFESVLTFLPFISDKWWGYLVKCILSSLYVMCKSLCYFMCRNLKLSFL